MSNPIQLATWRECTFVFGVLAVVLAGCPSDDDDGHETHAHEESGHSHASEAGHEETGHSHASEAGHEASDDHHASETSHEESTATTGEEDLAESYCTCVFGRCHEAYHDRWGEDEVVSRQACLAEAEALPSNGEPVEAGNFIECRIAYCERVEDDAASCGPALGESPCS